MEEDDLCKTAHKVSKIKYHFVFCIKYRKDLFLEEKYINNLKNICEGIQERYSIKFETIGFDEDHVHFMLQALPRFSPSRIFQIVKSISAIKLFENFPEIKKELWGGELWSDGGFVGTIGQTQGLEGIKKYIQRQGSKDKNYNLRDYIS